MKFSYLLIFALLCVTKVYADPELYFITPQDGDTVSAETKVSFGLRGMGVAPAGTDISNTGHHHLLIDVDTMPSMGVPLPKTDRLRHFGGGQTETSLNLPPGEHTLQLLLGNYLHIPHSPPVISEKITITVVAPGGSNSLDNVLAAQPEKVRQRYQYRHTKETLAFFGIESGMILIEGLPGGGWYSKILLPYLGTDGVLIGADYAESMYPKFGFFSQEQLDGKKTWVLDWTEEANGWRVDGDAKVTAFQFGSMSDEMKGTVDAVVMIRALHNLARFESDGEYLTSALNDVYNALKLGGVLGVVQHKARDDMPDDFADGSHGYLKQDFVIAQMEQAGFVYEASSDINNNPADQPTASDIVWRLPPSYVTSRDNPALKEKMQAIGESNRMTLRFRKPKQGN